MVRNNVTCLTQHINYVPHKKCVLIKNFQQKAIDTTIILLVHPEKHISFQSLFVYYAYGKTGQVLSRNACMSSTIVPRKGNNDNGSGSGTGVHVAVTCPSKWIYKNTKDRKEIRNLYVIEAVSD